jgi:hypothetical protein
MAWAALEPIVSHLRVYADDVEPGGPYRHVMTVTRISQTEVVVSGLRTDGRFKRADWLAISETLRGAGYEVAYFDRHGDGGEIVKHRITR